MVGMYAHITHRDHVVDLGDTQPVQDVGHEGLEAHVLDTGDELGGFEVFVSGVSTAFAEIVHEVSEENDEQCGKRYR